MEGEGEKMEEEGWRGGEGVEGGRGMEGEGHGHGQPS